MAKGPSFNIDQNAKSNLFCLFVALTIIGLLAMKGQNECRTHNGHLTQKKRNPVTSFMVKYMQPCDAPTSPQFKAPNAQISQLIGEQPNHKVYYRYAQPKVPTQRPASYSSR